MAQGRPFLEPHRGTIDNNLLNVSLSLCYSCNDVAIWIYDRLVWPQRGEAPLPNPDLPEHILRDYDEAGTILDLSPRGAAALLRLGVQQLCEHLGEKGKDINEDIASLVKKGLDVQAAAAAGTFSSIARRARPVTSRPSTSTLPVAGRSNPAMTRVSEVLPASVRPSSI